MKENFCFFIGHLAKIDEFEAFLENVELNFDRMAIILMQNRTHSMLMATKIFKERKLTFKLLVLGLTKSQTNQLIF